MYLDYPDGASAISLLSGNRICGRATEPRLLGGLVFGFDAAKTLKRCFPATSTLSPAEITLKYSAAPYLLATYAPEAADEILSRMISSERSAYLVKVTCRQARNVRRCPECVAADQQRLGLAFSRVAHQLVPVTHCFDHGCALEERCGSCGSGFADAAGAVLMGQRLREHIHECRNCHSEVGVPLVVSRSRGYSAFCELLAEVPTGATPLLRPRERAGLLEHCIFESGRRGVDLCREFSDFWGVATIDEAAVLCGATAADIRRSLERGWAPNEFYAIFAVVSFAVHYMRSLGVAYVGEFTPLLHLTALDRSDPLIAEMERPARDWGLNRALILALAAGNAEITFQTAGHQAFHISTFIKSLPLELRKSVLQRRAHAPEIAKLSMRVHAEGRKLGFSPVASTMVVEGAPLDHLLAVGCSEDKVVRLLANLGDEDRREVLRRRHSPPPWSRETAAAFSTIRDGHRARILSSLNPDTGEPPHSRTALSRVCQFSVQWCVARDSAWFDAVMPAIDLASYWKKKDASAESLAEAVDEIRRGNYKSRADLIRGHRTLYQWFMRFHYEQLLTELPGRGQGRKIQANTHDLLIRARRDADRASIEVALALHAKGESRVPITLRPRPALRKLARTALERAIESDAEWLASVAPPVPKGSRPLRERACNTVTSIAAPSKDVGRLR